MKILTKVLNYKQICYIAIGKKKHQCNILDTKNAKNYIGLITSIAKGT